MKQDDVKVSFYLKKNETKEDGKCPLMATLSIGKFSKTTFSAKMKFLYLHGWLGVLPEKLIRQAHRCKTWKTKRKLKGRVL